MECHQSRIVKRQVAVGCSVLVAIFAPRQEEFILEYMNMPGTIGFYRPWVWGLKDLYTAVGSVWSWGAVFWG